MDTIRRQKIYNTQRKTAERPKLLPLLHQLLINKKLHLQKKKKMELEGSSLTLFVKIIDSEKVNN